MGYFFGNYNKIHYSYWNNSKNVLIYYSGKLNDSNN